MAILFDAEVTPDVLTEYVRELPTPADLAFFNTIATRNVDDHKINLREVVHTNRTAKFRAFDGALPTMGRDGGSESEMSLLPLGNSISLGEYERLQIQFARTGGTATAALVDAIYNDAENLTASVYNRLELAWGQVLSTGKLTVNENGFIGEADFGVPEENVVDVATSWANPAALILDDLIAWQTAYEDTPGNGQAGALRIKRKNIRLMQRNTQLVELAVGKDSTRSRITIAELRDVLAAEDLPPLVELPDTSLDVDGTATKVIADDTALITPANLSDLGFTALGVSVTALELVNSAKSDMTFQGAAGLVGVVSKNDGVPYRQFTYVDGTAMPILAQPKRLFIANIG